MRVTLRHHVGQRSLRLVDAEAGVEVGPSEVHVDQGDAVPGPGQRDAEVGRDQRLADAALAAAHGHDATRATARGQLVRAWPGPGQLHHVVEAVALHVRQRRRKRILVGSPT